MSARATKASSLRAEIVDGVLVVSGPDLDQVLALVGERLGPDAEVLDAHRAIVGGVGGFFGREEFTVQARVAADVVEPILEAVHPLEAADGEGAVEAVAVDAPAPPAMNGADFAAALADALAEVDGARSDAARSDGVHSDAAALTGPLAGSLAEVDAVHANLTPAAFDLLHDPEPTAPRTPVLTEPAWGGAPLLALTAPELRADQLRAHLAELVGTPPVPPLHGIVAVVGDPGDALVTAEQLAARNGLEPDDVIVAAPGAVEGRPSWLTMTDPADAARRGARWGAAKRLTVVAVTLNPGIDGLQWTRDLLDALDADQVRLAVAGWRNLDEVVPRLQGLRRVDAIDLCSPVDPSAASGFLGLPVPVGLLAGRPATVDAWMDQLRPNGAPPPADPTGEESHVPHQIAPA